MIADLKEKNPIDISEHDEKCSSQKLSGRTEVRTQEIQFQRQESWQLLSKLGEKVVDILKLPNLKRV